jgi:hypothetical protein
MKSTLSSDVGSAKTKATLGNANGNAKEKAMPGSTSKKLKELGEVAALAESAQGGEVKTKQHRGMLLKHWWKV